MPPAANPAAPALVYPATFIGGADFYLSLLTLAVGIAACVYFLFEWLRHGEPRLLLYWSFGFLALFWFQIPAILANAGVGFSLADFNLFFTVSFPLSFAGYLAFYLGIRSAWPPGTTNRKGYLALAAWFAAALVVLWTYVAAGSSAGSHLLASIAVLFFVLPVQLLVLSGLWRWRKVLPRETGAVGRAGVAIMAAAFLVWIADTILSFQKVLLYPPAFWFVAMSEFRLGFIMETAGTLILLTGFFLVHHGYGRYLRTRSAAGAARDGAAGAAGSVASAGREPERLRALAQFVIAVVVSELAGTIGSLFTVPALPNWYANLNLPSFTPPGWVFSAAWATLFFLMGIAAFLVWRRGLGMPGVKTALVAFLIQLALNVGWSIIFFGAHLILVALVEAVVLWCAILWTLIRFGRVSRAAAWLLAPYLAWVSFAVFLNYSIWRMN